MKLMQPNTFVRSVVVLFTLCAPALLHAQFQPPTDDELKMTADPKAPGAAAVYLNYEEASDSPAHTRSIYERIKVLAEKGKEMATVSLPYERGVDKVTDIEGRTIHPDGAIIPLAAKPEDLMAIKTKGFQLNSVVFTLPDAQVGSILEFRIKLHRDDEWYFLPTWQIQRPFFVHKAHYSFRLGELQHVMYTTHVGSDSKVVSGKKDTITLDITDVPPEPNDDWMPPVNTLRWRVEFFTNNRRFTTSGAFWDDALKYWATWIANFTEPTRPIKNAVEAIVAPSDTDEQKAAKLYAAVQKLDNTDFSRKKSQAERKKEKLKEILKAEDVWKQQSGSANDIALLYASMARAAGLKVWPAYVVDRNRAIFDDSYLSDSQLDDNIVVVELGGKPVYLDPGQKMCPFGLLQWKHTLATGFRLTEKGAIIDTTPGLTYKISTVNRFADLQIDSEGNVTGSVRVVMNGPSALQWRQLALENDEDEVKKQFDESMGESLPEGVHADFNHFLGLDDYEKNLVGILNVTGNIGAAAGKHFFLPGPFFESRAKHPFVAQEKRTIPVDVHFPMTEQDDITYHLPPGFNLEEIPRDASTAWPNHALLKIHFAKDKADGSVTVSRTLAYNFTLLDPKEYPNLHDFYQKVATADQQQLVLTRTTTAAASGAN